MLKSGAVRFRNTDGTYEEYNPGHKMYKTALMHAEEIWDDKKKQWFPLNTPVVVSHA